MLLIFLAIVLALGSHIEVAILSLVFGIAFEGSSLLVFQRARDANNRMDNYHKESFEIRLLNILLKSSEQLQRDLGHFSKDRIIEMAANYWFKGKEVVDTIDPDLDSE